MVPHSPWEEVNSITLYPTFHQSPALTLTLIPAKCKCKRQNNPKNVNAKIQVPKIANVKKMQVQNKNSP